jgi:site-specific recombinase XerD
MTTARAAGPITAHPANRAGGRPPRGDLDLNLASWTRHLRAENLSPATVVTYTQSVSRLAEFLEAQGMPLEVADIRREHIEAFLEDLLTRFTPATAANRYSGLQAFFRWLEAEGEINGSPMARMQKPKQPERLAPVMIAGLHPHLLRHQAAHEYFAAGFQESDVMTLLGWRSREMLRRYAAGAAQERALAAARRLNPADRL